VSAKSSRAAPKPPLRAHPTLAEADASGSDTIVEPGGLADEAFGEALRLVWELEPGRRLLPASGLLEIRQDAFGAPGRLVAFLDAMRRSVLTGVPTRSLRAPFRSGADVKLYRLEPTWRPLHGSLAVYERLMPPRLIDGRVILDATIADASKERLDGAYAFDYLLGGFEARDFKADL
jgi:hypothetical protein